MLQGLERAAQDSSSGLTVSPLQHTNSSQFKKENLIHLSMEVGISHCLISCPRQNHHRDSPSTFLTPLKGIYAIADTKTSFTNDTGISKMEIFSIERKRPCKLYAAFPVQ